MPTATELYFALRSARESALASRFTSRDASGGREIAADLVPRNEDSGTILTKLQLVITLANNTRS